MSELEFNILYEHIGHTDTRPLFTVEGVGWNLQMPGPDCSKHR